MDPTSALKGALVGVTTIMDSIDRVGDVDYEFMRITNNVKGFQGIFSQYGSEEDISPAMCSSLDVVTSFQLNMGLHTPNYYMDVHGGKGGAGGMAKGGTGGNGGVGQGPNFNIQNATVNILSTDALEKLGCVDAADIDSQSPEGCLEGTRVDLLADLQAWSSDPNSPRIFWLDGMAGTGKSAIARSFCRMLREDKNLGGSFFCLRGDANRASTKRILTTLAVHLASQDPAYKWALLAALDRGISYNANLQIQVENLPIELFVTSRPERHIRPQFDNPADFRRVLRLHDTEDNIVTADISLYLRTCLDRIQADNSSILPPTWASPADVEALTHHAGRLFIYASTAMKYIRESPRSRLQTLISSKVYTKGPLTKPLDDLYNHILLNAVNIHRDESKEISLTKQILGTILMVGQPVSVALLGGLLGVPAWQVRERLDRLHAVIHVPAGDNDGVLSTFHASFGDFLTTAGRTSDEMLINPPAAHAALFSDCIRIMDSELHFNVSNCPTSYFPNTHHKLTIPALLQYVCLYWPHHIAAASFKLSQLDSLQDVFMPKLLFWVEVLSAINKASVASSLIMKALTAKCFMHGPPYITEFLADANEFVLSSMEAIETSVAHIYLSALPCLQPISKVAKAFWPKFDRIPQLHLTGIQRQREATLILQGHDDGVCCIAISADGACIVSGSHDNTIRVWDGRTGEAIMEPIRGHTDSVLSVAFSSDGACIVSGSSDETIRVWDVGTGRAVMEPIQGHTGWVLAVVFSPDGAHIMSGSSDNTICVWDARTGEAVMEPIRGHTDSVSVAFSSDGARIVSGSSDKTIRVWDTRTGEAIMEPIQGHTDWVRSVVFSPDGALVTSLDGAHIVSGSDDNTICVWDARTGEAVMEPIQGHMDWVRSVAFSPDGTCIVSGSNDRTICVWDARTGEAIMEPIQGHTSFINSVIFSPDGVHILSASSDKTICVWDARMGQANIEPIQGHAGWSGLSRFRPTEHASCRAHMTIRVWDARTGKADMEAIQGHTGSVRSVAFSPDGARIVSGSSDKTIHVWGRVRLS
ncbi:quinon protein alcohol dehydrogenase-like superfamily [Mycena galericulata]|nr:quinon protein alcohol dehydrogenase-like superfamily [Mycena galericulata]